MVDGNQLQQLQAALLSAFPTEGELAQLVRFGLNENLQSISLGANLREVVFHLIEWAVAHGQLENLSRAALASNPTNPALQAYAIDSSFLASTGAAGGQLTSPTITAGRDAYVGNTINYPAADLPAIRDGLLELVTLSEPSTAEGYYEGKKARLGHILAGLDAPRRILSKKGGSTRGAEFGIL